MMRVRRRVRIRLFVVRWGVCRSVVIRRVLLPVVRPICRVMCVSGRRASAGCILVCCALLSMIVSGCCVVVGMLMIEIMCGVGRV